MLILLLSLVLYPFGVVIIAWLDSILPASTGRRREGGFNPDNYRGDTR